MSKRLPLRDAMARLERRDPVLPSLLALPPAPTITFTAPARDRRTMSVEVRIDRALFLRYRALQHELRQHGQGEPTLRQIVAALLERLPEEPEAVHRLVAAWRSEDPESRRPYGERDLHRLRIDLPTGLVRRVEALLFSLELDGRPIAFSDVVRACLAHGPRSTAELTEVLGSGDQDTTGPIDDPPPDGTHAGPETQLDTHDGRHEGDERVPRDESDPAPFAVSEESTVRRGLAG
jgi:hypothetical protein